MRGRCLQSLTALAMLTACTEGTAPGRSPVADCEPIFGFPMMGMTPYSLTRIDGAAPPQSITFRGSAFSVGAGQLDLNADATEYLWAFWESPERLVGTTLIRSGTGVALAHGTVQLLAGDDSATVLGIAEHVSEGAGIRVVTTDRPALGDDNFGAHEFLYAPCP